MPQKQSQRPRAKLKPCVAAFAVAASFSTRPASADAADGAQLYALQVLPAGPVTVPADGRPALIHDNAALAAEFNAKGRPGLLDVGHLSEYCETAAAGWVVELSVSDDDGALWAWVDFTAEGRKLIDEKQFGFTSPTLYIRDVEGGWQVSRFKSLALTNNPAIDTMSANFTAEAEADDDGYDDADAEPVEAETAAEATADSAAKATTAAVEPAEVAEDGAGTASESEAQQEPGEAAPGTAALSSTAAAPATLDMAHVTTSIATLTAERDTALSQLTTLSQQITSLTAERDTAIQELASFKTAQTAAEVARLLAQFTASGQCTPAEHEDLREYAATLGVDKLKASLSKRVPLAAFTRLPLPAGTPATDPAVPVEVAEYLSRLGGEHLVSAYKRGVSGK